MYHDYEINPSIVKNIGKVIIAAAWADGEVQDEEVEVIKDMLEKLPDISPEELAILESFLETPVEATEREVIIEELDEAVETQDERNFAIYWLEQVINATGSVIDEEREFLDTVKLTLDPNRAGRVTYDDVEAVQPVCGNTSLAEQDINTRRLIARKLRRLHAEKLLFKMTDEARRELVVSVMLLSAITRADHRISEFEVETMVDYVCKRWKVSADEAHKTVTILLGQSIDESEAPHLCRALRTLSSPEARSELLEVLFTVSLDEGKLEDAEVQQITFIAAMLDLSQAEYQKHLNEHKEAIAI